MKLMSILILFTCLKLSLFSAAKFDVSKLKISSKTDQLIIAIPLEKKSHLGYLYYYIKEGNNWSEYLVSDAHFGKNGLGKEIEGDLKTPIGVYEFNSYFGIADNPGTKLPYIKLNNSLYWDGDSNSKNYNKMVNIETYDDFDIAESEHLIDEILAYQYVMSINYNKDRIPHKGSAIFLHCYTENPYTAGCIAVPHSNMLKIYQKANKKAKIIIDYEENIYYY